MAIIGLPLTLQEVANLPLDRVLAVVGRRDLPLRGTIGLTAPEFPEPCKIPGLGESDYGKWLGISTDLYSLRSASHLQQPRNQSQRFHVENGPSFVDESLAFTHPANDLDDGNVQFQVKSNQIQLARLKTIPGLAGSAQLTADGVAQLHQSLCAPVLSSLNANKHATGISVENSQNLGDVTATATTRGSDIAFNLTSNLANSEYQRIRFGRPPAGNLSSKRARQFSERELSRLESSIG